METTQPSDSVKNPYYDDPPLIAKLMTDHVKKGVLSADNLLLVAERMRAVVEAAFKENNESRQKQQSLLENMVPRLLKQWETYQASVTDRLNRPLSGAEGKMEQEDHELKTKMFEDLVKTFNTVHNAINDKRASVHKDFSDKEFTQLYADTEQQILKILQGQLEQLNIKDKRQADPVGQAGEEPPAVQKPPENYFKFGRPDIRLFGRNALLLTLTNLCFSEHINWSQPDVMIILNLCGEPGVGKSELALKFGRQNLHRFSFFYVLRAHSIDTLDADYQDIALRLNIPLMISDTADVIKVKVHNRLCRLEKPFLLVYEGLTQPINLPSSGGIIFIISNHYRAVDPRHKICVPPLDEASAIELLMSYLSRKAPPENPPAEDLHSMVSFLGRNPLLIDSVGRILISSPTLRLRAFYHQLKNGHFDCPNTSHPAYYINDLRPVRPYASRITEILRDIQASDPASLKCLRACAYLSPHRIPLTFIGELLTLIPGRLNGASQESVIRTLVEHALITINEDLRTFSLSPITQSLIRNPPQWTEEAPILDLICQLLRNNRAYHREFLAEIHPLLSWSEGPKKTLLEGRSIGGKAERLQNGNIVYPCRDNAVRIATEEGVWLSTINLKSTPSAITQINENLLGIDMPGMFAVYRLDGSLVRALTCRKALKLRDGRICLIGTTNSYEIWKHHDGRVSAGQDSTLEVWNSDLSRLLRHCTIPHSKRIFDQLVELPNDILLTPEPHSLAGWNFAGECRVHTGQFDPHTNHYYDTILLSDNNLATACRDGTVKVWSLQAPDCLETLGIDLRPCERIREFAGGVIAAGYEDGSFRLWRRGQGCILTIQADSEGIRNIEELHDGVFITEAGTRISIWSRTGDCMLTLRGMNCNVIHPRLLLYRSENRDGYWILLSLPSLF